MPLKFLHSLIWLRALCVVAAMGIATSAPAHSAVDSDGFQDAAQYALPDGTVPVICFGNGANDKTDARHDCGECCLAAQGFLKPPTHACKILPREVALQSVLPLELLLIEVTRSANNPSRAPPTL